MYVRWKILIFFGLVFWLLSCLTDYLKPKPHPERFTQQYLLDEDPEETPEPTKTFEGYFMRILAVSLTVILIGVTIKFALDKVTVTFRRSWLKLREIPKRRRSSFCNITEAKNVEETDGTPPNSDKEYHYKHVERKKSKSSRQLEKHCAKLREEILVLQATSSQEQQHLAKKIEIISREKKDLHKQLTTALKENRAAKQQLEEILSERSLLIKRLEIATKEIKVNTKTKKNTLTKLEEALVNMDKLKLKLDQVTRDKEVLEDKLLVLEKEYNQLKDQAYIYTLNSNEDPVMENEKEHAVDTQVSDCGDGFEDMRSVSQIVDDFDIAQPEKDIKIVAQKLFNLERALETLGLKEVKKNISGEDLEENWKSPDLQKFNSNSKDFKSNLNEFNQKLNQNSHEFNQNSHEFNQNSHEFNQNSHEFNQNSHELKHNSHEFNQNTHEFNQNSHEFNQTSHDFNQNSHDFKQNLNNFNRNLNDFHDEQDEVSFNSICTEPDCQLEHCECRKHECFLRHNHQVQKHKIEEIPEKNVYEQEEVKRPRFEVVTNYVNVNCKPKMKEKLQRISEKSSPTPSDAVEDDDDEYEDEEEEGTVEYEEEEDDDDEYEEEVREVEVFMKKGMKTKKGILSSSPLFLKFLANILETQV